MKTLVIENETNKEEIIKRINKFRLENKNNWYQLDITYTPNRYLVKAFNTSIQIFKEANRNINYGGIYDLNVSEFKSYLYDNIK